MIKKKKKPKHVKINIMQKCSRKWDNKKVHKYCSLDRDCAFNMKNLYLFHNLRLELHLGIWTLVASL